MFLLCSQKHSSVRYRSEKQNGAAQQRSQTNGGEKPPLPAKPLRPNGRAPMTNGENTEDLDDAPQPPPRKLRNEFLERPVQGACNGLPPTPKVPVSMVAMETFLNGIP